MQHIDTLHGRGQNSRKLYRYRGFFAFWSVAVQYMHILHGVESKSEETCILTTFLLIVAPSHARWSWFACEGVAWSVECCLVARVLSVMPLVCHHMDFISPHPPRLSGKEIQGEPRGTFWISSAPRGLAISLCRWKSKKLGVLPRGKCRHFFEFLSMTKITGPPRWLIFIDSWHTNALESACVAKCCLVG